MKMFALLFTNNETLLQGNVPEELPLEDDVKKYRQYSMDTINSICDIFDNGKGTEQDAIKLS